MKDRIVLSHGICEGRAIGTYDDKDGHHFCTQCGKKLRVGEKAIETWGPAFLRRQIEYRYSHEKCP